MRYVGVFLASLTACSQQPTTTQPRIAASPRAPLAQWCESDVACGKNGHCEFGVCEHVDPDFGSASAARWNDEACWLGRERRVVQALTPHGDDCLTLTTARQRCDSAHSPEDCLGTAVLLHLSGDQDSAQGYFKLACGSGVDAACKHVE